MNQPVALAVHHCEHPDSSFDVGPIEDQVLDAINLRLASRWALEPVVDDPSERSGTVAALLAQLSDRVAFLDPSLEPDSLPMSTCSLVAPAEGPMTAQTQEALSAVPTQAVELDAGVTTPDTPLFEP